MWYPTLPDILDLHDQICAVHEVPAQVSNMPAVDEAILAPQHLGEEERTAVALARKSAALIEPLVQKQPFDHCGDRVAYSLAQRFVDRNGYVLRASLKEVTGAFDALRSEEITLKELSSWLESQLSTRFDTPHRNRVFSALNTLASVKEDLDQVAGFTQHVEDVDTVGWVISQQMTALFRLDREDKRDLEERFPALWKAWKDALLAK